MKLTPINAPDAPYIAGTYARAMSIKGAEELLIISGQIPVDADGNQSDDPVEQGHQVFANIDAQLRAAGMTKDNLVKITIYLASRRYIHAYRTARDAYLQGREIALTCIITGIFDESWVMEIEAMAAR